MTSKNEVLGRTYDISFSIHSVYMQIVKYTIVIVTLFSNTNYSARLTGIDIELVEMFST
jgi:hypothetical protein